MMIADSMPQKTVTFVRTSAGSFGPYPSRQYAEHMIASGQIPTKPGELPIIQEKFEDGREPLFG